MAEVAEDEEEDNEIEESVADIVSQKSRRETPINKNAAHQNFIDKSLGDSAVDELNLITDMLCLQLEQFYKPFTPTNVRKALHEDFLRLSYQILFEQNRHQVYRTIAILMRVDTYVNDKDLRDKHKILRKYTPNEFGLEPLFCFGVI